MRGAGSDTNDHDGIVDGHAYSLITVRKNVCGKFDLMLFRNPHGKTEFQGEWHDGSKEWQQHPTAAQELNYTQDPNDGLFWISKADAFRYFQTCRLPRIVHPVCSRDCSLRCWLGRFYVLCKSMESPLSAKRVVTHGHDGNAKQVSEVSEIRRINREFNNARRDLFSQGFDGVWNSSDGAPVCITETDGVFTVNGVVVDGFVNVKTMMVTFKGMYGMYSLHVNYDGTAVRFLCCPRRLAGLLALVNVSRLNGVGALDPVPQRCPLDEGC